MLLISENINIGTMNTEFAPAQTSVPNWLMTYLHQLADVHYGRKLNKMHVHMLESFLVYQPWKAHPPLDWRIAKSHRTRAAGWVPMNMILPTELVDRMKHIIEGINEGESARILGGESSTLPRAVLSLRTFMYTAIYWWCTAVFPYDGNQLINSQ